MSVTILSENCFPSNKMILLTWHSGKTLKQPAYLCRSRSISTCHCLQTFPKFFKIGSQSSTAQVWNLFPNIANTHIYTQRKLQNQNGLVLLSKFSQSLVAGASSKARLCIHSFNSIVLSSKAHQQVHKISQ